MVASRRPNPTSPKRYMDELNNEFVSRKVQKAEEDADLQADIAAIKAAKEAEALHAEYQRRMEAWNPAVVAAAAPAVAVADAYQGWVYQGGYDSDGYVSDGSQFGYSSNRCDMCHDGTCPHCCDDCHGA